VPLILLYELSVILAKLVGTSPDAAAERDITVSEPPPSGAT
jgi:Sec-independent protein secretion pathway component TatC